MLQCVVLVYLASIMLLSLITCSRNMCSVKIKDALVT
jgi:hypothetical protein